MMDIPGVKKWVQHNFFRKADSTDTTRGAQDKNRPVVLNSSGYLDTSLFKCKGSAVYHDAAQSLATGTFTTLAFNSERYDNGFHSTVTNNSRLTVPAGLSGKFLVTAGIEFLQNATGYRAIGIWLNGTTYVRFLNTPAIATQDQWLAISAVVAMSAGDYVQVRAIQTSGGALDVRTDSAFSPEFSITYLGV